MSARFKQYVADRLGEIRNTGLYKAERVIKTSQNSHIQVDESRYVLNLCSNDYLGLSEHPYIIRAVQEGLAVYGCGPSSVRSSGGTQAIHRLLENALSCFLGTQDTILYSSCFEANVGLFETFLESKDAIIFDELSNSSIVDGIQLCKARRLQYRNSSMVDLEDQLKEASSARFRVIATDGVFSMNGQIADLGNICELADKYGAIVMVDDSHGVGIVGKSGRGTHEYRDVMGRIDILTGSLGTALGGASGGYTSGSQELVGLLRQRSRPYLFSNLLTPAVVAGSIRAINLLSESTRLKDRLESNMRLFRQELLSRNFAVLSGQHPVISILLANTALAIEASELILNKGVYVISSSSSEVPNRRACIRTQVSAAHTQDDLRFALDCFVAVKQELGI